MELDPDFTEFLRFCGAHRVRYLVVGGYAVAAHGHPRFTKDLDIWIAIDADNAARLLVALQEFGFGSLGLAAEDFTQPNAVVQLGYPPKRIDILTSASGVDFAECYTRRVDVAVTGLDRPVPFIGTNDLVANKVATGRLQDLADVEALRSQPGPDLAD